MEAFERVVDVVVKELGSTATSKAIAGAPIEVGGVKLVILSTLAVGMGLMEGEGEGQASPYKKAKAGPGSGSGEGVGGGAKVRPAAVLAFTAEGVRVLPIPDQPGPIDKVIERIPAVAEMVDKVRHTFEESAPHA